MKQSASRRWRESRGVRVEHGKGQAELYVHGRQSTSPRHPSKEIGEGVRRAILKQLGLSDR